MTTEFASRKVWVLASDEVLEEMRTGWSRPVQTHAAENPDGSWDMTFRTYSFWGVFDREIDPKDA